MSKTVQSASSPPKQLYLRMTPDLMAELAYQHASITASRLTLNQQREFWMKLARYINETDPR